MKQLIQVINRAKFGRHSSNRYLAHATACLDLLAQAGNAQAMYRLGMLNWDGQGIPEDRERALALLRAAADEGVRAALYNLGVAYDKGYYVAQNYYQAFHYYTQAAKLGDVKAMHAVGSMLDAGEGTYQHPAKAKYWFLKAAKQGHAIAMYDLASHYQLGIGTQQNSRLAIYWFKQALGAGEIRALTGLGYCYYKLVLPPDLARAQSYFEQASELGYGNATYNLGVIAEKGIGQKPLLPDALFWYKRAADLGHEGAALKVAEMLGELF